jgi:L-fucose mutarotase
MLKRIDPLLSAQLLTILAEMGHGDELAIVDANFPAVTMGKRVARISASAVTTLEHFLFYCRPLRASLNQAWALAGVVYGRASVMA